MPNDAYSVSVANYVGEQCNMLLKRIQTLATESSSFITVINDISADAEMVIDDLTRTNFESDEASDMLVTGVKDDIIAIETKIRNVRDGINLINNDGISAIEKNIISKTAIMNEKARGSFRKELTQSVTDTKGHLKKIHDLIEAKIQADETSIKSLKTIMNKLDSMLIR